MHYDYETFSEQDLKAVGVSRYARDPSTRILMGAYRFDIDRRYRQFSPEEGDAIPAEFEDALADDRIEKWAWNAVFELQIGEHRGLPVSHLDHYCTMVAAMSLSFPGKLEKAGKAIGLPEDKQKNARGLALIRKFCKPNKPTKKNPTGLWTFENAPDDWDEFLEYNVDDVIAECAIYDRLERWIPDEDFWDDWREDYAINRAGLPMSRSMISNAQTIYETGLEVKFKEMRELTGLANPNSNVQLLPWLQDEGYVFDDLKAAHVKRAKDMLGEQVEDGRAHPAEIEHLYRVLELRADTSMTSIKKFEALLRAMDDDDTLRFVLQFHGAQRTGRWAGRIYQPQNLPRPAKQFEKAIETWARMVEHLTYAQIDLLVEDIFELLKSCIRPAAQAPEGYVFIDADLNAIENRVLGWLARCEKILRVFELKRDPYIDFATYLFHESYDTLWNEWKVEGNSKKRTIAKPGVLGCLKGDTPVLTHRGWKALIEITNDDWLHDGRTWVKHDGVIFKGHQAVLCRSGIHATPDHRFLTREGWHEWRQVVQQPMLSSAHDMANGLLLNTFIPAEAQGRFSVADAGAVENEAYPDLTLCEDYPHVAPAALLRIVAPTSENESAQRCSTRSQIVSMLRERVARTRRTVPTVITESAEYVAYSIPQKSGLPMSRELSGPMAPSKSTGSTTTDTTNPATSDSQPDQCRTAISDTWDILNTGAYARFVVLTDGGYLVSHNCGYMLSAGAAFENKKTGEIEATGLLGYAWNMGVRDFTQEQSSLSVDTFRREFDEVKSYWYEIERAMRRCIKNRRTVDFDHLRFVYDDPFIRMVLPSGRSLHYYDAQIRSVRAPWGDYKPTITYMGLDDRKMWTRLSTHPGKITENADQAISRDLLMHGISIARRRGIDVRLHVHDQIIGLVKEDEAEAQLAILIDSMQQRPWWAPDLPLGSEGFISKVMKKD